MLSWTDINANAVRFAKKHVDDCKGNSGNSRRHKRKAVLEFYGMKLARPQIVTELMRRSQQLTATLG